MKGQGTDDQWENYRGCTNWGKRHYRDENRDYWVVGKQKVPLNLRARRSQFWCRTEDVRTIPEDDMNADRWKAEAPPGIGVTNERSQNKTARCGEMNKQSADEEREGSWRHESRNLKNKPNGCMIEWRRRKQAHGAKAFHGDKKMRVMTGKSGKEVGAFG